NVESSSESFLLLLNGIIEKSNRMLQVGEYKMPIMTSEDLLFADLGKIKMPDGRIAQKRVLMTFDCYTLTPDSLRIIYAYPSLNSPRLHLNSVCALAVMTGNIVRSDVYVKYLFSPNSPRLQR